VISKATAVRSNDLLEQRTTINIAKSIRASFACGRFLGLVVVDRSKMPLGFFGRDHFLDLLALPVTGYGTAIRQCTPTDQAFCDKLFKDIASTELGVVLLHPEERAKSDEAHKIVVAWDAVFGETYKKMIEARIGLAMIADRHRMFDGIITRAAIESRFVGRLIEATK
jgi:hypothetical protein